MNSPNQLSFLPDDYLETKRQRRTNFICAMLFIVVMGAIGSAFYVTERQMKDIEKQHAIVSGDYTVAARRIEQVQKMQQQQRTMSRQADLTASLLERVPRSYLLAELTNSLPDGVSLLEFVLDSHVRQPVISSANKTAFEQRKAAQETRSSETVPEPRSYEVTLRATGIADTDVQVAQFMNRLSRSRLLSDVNLVISDQFTQADQKVRKFQIEMKINPEANVQKATVAPIQTTAVDTGDKL